MVSKSKIGVAIVAASVVTATVGIACWYGGRANLESAMSATQSPSTGTKDQKDFLSGTEPWFNLHLPSYTIPIHYDLTLYPDFYGDNAEFYGNVTITIDVKQATYYLLVHHKRLTLSAQSIIDESGKEYGIEDQFGYDPNQFWVMKLKDMIPESTRVYLTIKFSGSLEDGIVGFYKAKYDNGTKAMATSKFEPVDARKAFPCFDEPNLKATFTTTLVHNSSYTSLSNMPVESNTTRTDGLMVTKFKKSVPMSTYLACFIVCDCEYDERTLTSGKPFRVYTIKGSIAQAKYAVELGTNVTNYFETYFGLDYPLPKMDMIAIPDFVSGAMEHWGLITYRETNLLYKPGVSSPSNKQRIAEVIIHELAHQWFGNIVTMDWWDDLWLNEGFATFMAYVGAEEYEPDMQFMSQFSVLEAYGVMPQDSEVSSHPIIVPVKRPEEITAVFDAISYNKGASVIRMLEDFVGENKFKAALTEYLKRYRYENAKTFQLWEAFGEEATDIKVREIMDTWTRQAGFPLITINYKNDTKKLFASQQLFRADTNKSQSEWPKSPYNYTWEVPLHYSSSQSGDTNITWMKQNESEVELQMSIDLTSADSFIKFNREAAGYYVVNYDEWVWNRFGQILKNDTNKLSPSDRAELIFDSTILSRTGYLGYNVTLSFLKYLTDEDHYVPWTAAYSRLFYLRNRLDNSTWNEFVHTLISKTYERLAWKEGGSHLDQLLRGSITRLACGHELEHCLNVTQFKFVQWLSDPVNASIDAGIRRDVFTYGMRNVTQTEWDTVWQRYNSELVASAKADIRRGLTETRNPVIMDKLLGYCLDKDKVSDQDFFTVVWLLAGNPAAFDKVWNWSKDNYETILTRFGIESRSFGRFIPYMAADFNSQEELTEVKEFYLKYPDAGAGKRAREQSIEKISSNIGWTKRYREKVLQYVSASS